MFTKETFLMTIDALEKQNEFDRGYANVLSGVLNASDVQTYDNSSITNLLFTLLQRQFVPVDGNCEIERYCYELNFGWADGNRIYTPEDLWNALIERRSLVVDSVGPFGHPFSDKEVSNIEIKEIIKFQSTPIFPNFEMQVVENNTIKFETITRHFVQGLWYDFVHKQIFALDDNSINSISKACQVFIERAYIDLILRRVDVSKVSPSKDQRSIQEILFQDPTIAAFVNYELDFNKISSSNEEQKEPEEAQS